MTNRIAFQGEPGAYSHEACRNARPEMEALPCRTFEDVIESVRSGAADLAMLPVENSTYGRVADIHSLLPESGLYIIAEHFVPVRIQLLGVPGAKLEAVIQRNMRELIDMLVADPDMLPSEAAEQIAINRIATSESGRTVADVMVDIPTILISQTVREAAELLGRLEDAAPTRNQD